MTWMSSRTRERFSWGIGLAVAGAVVLGACGSDDGGGTAEAAAPTTGAASTANPEAEALCGQLADGGNEVTFAEVEEAVPEAGELVAADDLPCPDEAELVAVYLEEYGTIGESTTLGQIRAEKLVQSIPQGVPRETSEIASVLEASELPDDGIYVRQLLGVGAGAELYVGEWRTPSPAGWDAAAPDDFSWVSLTAEDGRFTVFVPTEHGEVDPAAEGPPAIPMTIEQCYWPEKPADPTCGDVTVG